MSDVFNPNAYISVVNSSIVPESPCLKIVDIELAPAEDRIISSLNHSVASTSKTFYFLFRPWGKTSIQIWDVHACQLVGTINPPHESIPRKWDVTSDGDTFFLARENMVELWDIHSSSFIRALKPKSIDQGFVSSLSVSPDARKLAVLYGEIVHIYHLETGILSTSRVLAEGNDQSQVITWSPNSDRMLTYTTNPEHGRKSTQASVVHGWRITDSAIEPIAEAIKLHRYGPATNIMFPGETIIYINQERDIIIGHLENGHFQTQIQRRQEDCCYPYTLSPDGQMFACATRDRMCVMLRDATSGNVIGGPLQNSSGRAISSLCFTSGGKQLVSLCPYTTIRFWDVEAAIELYRVANSQAEATTSSVLKEVNLSISTPLFNDNAPHQEEGPSTTTPTSLQNTPRRRSGSSDSSILNLPISDVPMPSATLSTPTPTPYTRRRERRKPTEYDSLLDLPATGVPVRPPAQDSPSNAPRSPPALQRSGNQSEAAAVAPGAPGHSQRRAPLTALWARIRRRRKPSPTSERGSRAHKNKPKSESISMRDLADTPELPSAPTPTHDSGIVEVAAGRLDERLIIAPPRKKKKKNPPVPPPLTSEDLQPASQSNVSSSSSLRSSSSHTDSDAESIDWLDYICFCMCLPSNKARKKKWKEKEKAEH